MENIIFFDLEWVPVTKSLLELSKLNLPLANAWKKRCSRWRDLGKFEEMTDGEIWSQSAGLNPEFIKIIVASLGFYNTDGTLEVQSFTSVDGEHELLLNIKRIFDGAGGWRLCGQSIKRYDMPYLGKRMLSHGISLPYHLNNFGKKPWDLTAIDVNEMWGCGSMGESYTPLDTICAALGVETSKSDIAGKDVARVYYNEGDEGLERIKVYCEKDVIATAEIYKKINNLIKIN